ncbi:hypothetical protein H6P81_014450 [Aristolochia fimbriata]|uniref:FBD domain-containing protein n=1 Tax=Aristolochia fimbriata TaxID=158543 RepID=A0AAV7EKU6_ARIFI|nr:hypothetical protein H6P81_014450 [Aristolochia fimbriata]
MKAKVLHLEVEDDPASLQVPSSETLETLTVVARRNVTVDMSTCFPLLKTIELTRVLFPINFSMGFFSFFPSLETLLLDNVALESPIHIFSPSLRILKVTHNERFNYEVHVWASHLVSLEYECVDPRPGVFVVEGASSLVDAKITCWKRQRGEPWLGPMIDCLSSVTKLTLNLSINQLLDLVEVVRARKGTSFSNMTCLTICLCDCNCKYCFDSAICLLHKCPILEQLFLRFMNDDHQPNGPHEAAASPRKLSMSHLRQVQMVADESYHSYDKIMAKWVELLLENSTNLDQITIKRVDEEGPSSSQSYSERSPSN